MVYIWFTYGLHMVGPARPRAAPAWFQRGPERPHRDPRETQSDPNEAQSDPSEARRGPERPQRGPSEAPARPRATPARRTHVRDTHTAGIDFDDLCVGVKKEVCKQKANTYNRQPRAECNYAAAPLPQGTMLKTRCAQEPGML